MSFKNMKLSYVNGKRVFTEVVETCPRVTAVMHGKLGHYPIDRVITELLSGKQVEVDLDHLMDLTIGWNPFWAGKLMLWVYFPGHLNC